jgi:hypothetical protein
MLASTDWNEWVGLGTLALAGVTVLLAVVSAVGVWVAAKSGRDTRRLAATAEEEVRKIGEQIDVQRDEVAAVKEQARASVRQVEFAEATLDTTLRPVLVDVPSSNQGADLLIYNPPVGDGFAAPPSGTRLAAGWEIEVAQRDDEQVLYVSVPLRNAGPGIAVATSRPVLTWDDTGDSHLGRLSLAVVPPGERTRARFELRLYDQDAPNQDGRQIRAVHAILGTGGRGFGAFFVEASYVNIRGSGAFRSRVEIAQVEEAGQWIYRPLRLHLYEGDAASPAVSSEIAAP